MIQVPPNIMAREARWPCEDETLRRAGLGEAETGPIFHSQYTKMRDAEQRPLGSGGDKRQQEPPLVGIETCLSSMSALARGVHILWTRA